MFKLIFFIMNNFDALEEDHHKKKSFAIYKKSSFHFVYDICIIVINS